MRRISVGLLKKPVKQLNADQGKIVAFVAEEDFSTEGLEMQAVA